MDSEDIRDALEKELGEPILDVTWDYLDEMDFVAEVMDGFLSVDELAAAVRTFYRVTGQSFGGQGRGRRPSQPRDWDEHDASMSLLTALEAERDEDVLAFRKDVLDGNLLEEDEVADWMEARAKEQDQPTLWLHGVPVPANHKLIPTGWGWITDPPLVLEGNVGALNARDHRLAYPRRDGGLAESVTTAAYGPLERLRLLTEALCEKYRWAPAAATSFVLSGSTPLVRAFRAYYSGRQPSALSRIHLEFDPSMSPRELADRYRELRPDMVGRRHRRIEEKSYKLAYIYAATRLKNVGITRLFNVWNTVFPDWKYTKQTNFARDAKRAYQRLMEPERGAPAFADVAQGTVVDEATGIRYTKTRSAAN